LKEGFIRGVLTYIRIALGAVIYSFAISGFLDPNSLAPGGVTGLAMIVNRLTDIETGTLILLINIPILLLGLRKFGIKFVASTIYCIFLVSVFTNIFSIKSPLLTP